MNTGMLWFDDNPKIELKNKIQRAVDYYQNKYGQHPDLCMLNPNMISKEQVIAGKNEALEIRAVPYILPHHFWIGVKES